MGAGGGWEVDSTMGSSGRANTGRDFQTAAADEKSYVN